MKQVSVQTRKPSEEVISKREGKKKLFSVGISVKYYENH
jgi:hypothetical protein